MLLNFAFDLALVFDVGFPKESYMYGVKISIYVIANKMYDVNLLFE